MRRKAGLRWPWEGPTPTPSWGGLTALGRGEEPRLGRGASREPAADGHVVRGTRRGPSQAPVIISGAPEPGRAGLSRRTMQGRCGKVTSRPSLRPGQALRDGASLSGQLGGDCAPAGRCPALSHKSHHLQLLTVRAQGQAAAAAAPRDELADHRARCPTSDCFSENEK